MAFGYKVPNFNLWCRMFRVNFGAGDRTTRYYNPPVYSVCSLASARDSISLPILKLPKYTSVRNYRNTPYVAGDIVQIGGNEMFGWYILDTEIVGAGFANEHISCLLSPLTDQGDAGTDGLQMGQCRNDLLPPDGFTPWSLQLPADFWQDPSEVELHPPP